MYKFSFSVCVYCFNDNKQTPTCYKDATVFSFYISMISCLAQKCHVIFLMKTILTFSDWLPPIVKKKQKTAPEGIFKIFSNSPKNNHGKFA